MAKKHKLVASVRVEANRALWLTEKNGVDVTPNTRIDLTPGLWYILGDGSSRDLLKMIVDQAILADSDLDDLVFDMSVKDGRVSHKLSGADLSSIQIRWGNPAATVHTGTDVRDFLRLGTFDGFAGTEYKLQPAPFTKTAPMTHLGGFYPNLHMLKDLEMWEPEVSQFVPSVGNVQTFRAAMRLMYLLTFRSTGIPREDDTHNEFHDMKRWIEHAAGGYPFRLYVDRTKTTAYSEPEFGTTNRTGFQSMTLHKDSMQWEPQPDDPLRYEYIQHELMAYHYKENFS